MAKQEIANNAYYALYYHDEEKIIHHVFKEQLESNSFKEVLLKGTEVLTEESATKWLSDNRRQVKVLSDEDNAWANTVWLPDTMNAGWKYWAIVVPHSMANRADLVRYVDSFHDKGIVVKVFVDDDDALKWLKSK